MDNQPQSTNIQPNGHSSSHSNTTAHTCVCREFSPEVRKALRMLQGVNDGDDSAKLLLLWEQKYSKSRRELYVKDNPKWGANELKEIALKFPLGRSAPVYEPRSLSDLREFLIKAKFEEILAHTSTTKVAILDQRNDDGLEYLAKFGSYPAQGNSVQLVLADETELYDALLEDRLKSGGHKRTIHTNAITPNIAWIWAATCSIFTDDELRDFLSRTIPFNAYISVETKFVFKLEFHIPYYRLVAGEIQPDIRGLRKSSSFPPFGKNSDYVLYQTQWSALVVGLDESHWTCYCSPDLYMYGEEIDDEIISWDRSSGRPAEHPTWDPREYFLHCLRNCTSNVVRDWKRVLEVLDDKISAPINVVFGEGNVDDFLSDDYKFTRSRLYDWALQALTIFQECLQNVINSWEEFYEEEIKFLRENGSSGNRISRERMLSEIDKDIKALCKMSQRIDSQSVRLCTLRDSVIGFSALKESRTATKQSADLKFLTMVAAIFLPYQCVTGTFSLKLLEDSSLMSILCIITLFTAGTILLTFNLPRLADILAPKIHEVSEGLLQKMESVEDWKWRAPGLKQRKSTPEVVYHEDTELAESDWWYLLFVLDYYIIKWPSSEFINLLNTPSEMGWVRKLCLPVWFFWCLAELTLLFFLSVLAFAIRLPYRLVRGEELGFLGVLYGPAELTGIQRLWEAHKEVMSRSLKSDNVSDVGSVKLSTEG